MVVSRGLGYYTQLILSALLTVVALDDRQRKKEEEVK